jgi:hypothetical protein
MGRLPGVTGQVTSKTSADRRSALRAGACEVLATCLRGDYQMPAGCPGAA